MSTETHIIAGIIRADDTLGPHVRAFLFDAHNAPYLLAARGPANTPMVCLADSSPGHLHLAYDVRTTETVANLLTVPILAMGSPTFVDQVRLHAKLTVAQTELLVAATDAALRLAAETFPSWREWAEVAGIDVPPTTLAEGSVA